MEPQNTRRKPALGGASMKRVDTDLATLVARARLLVETGGRRILGIAGPPGAGKSRLAAALVETLAPPAAALVALDGFHLSGAELGRLGRQDRKGAPDTFDAAGYVALLRRLRDPAEDVVYAPEFRRQMEEPIAGAVLVSREVPLVITEGNYLLLDRGRWSEVRGLLDEAWYLDTPEEARLQRLVERHIAYGKSPAEARAWATGSDQRNAELVSPTRERADLVVRLVTS